MSTAKVTVVTCPWCNTKRSVDIRQIEASQERERLAPRSARGLRLPMAPISQGAQITPMYCPYCGKPEHD